MAATYLPLTQAAHELGISSSTLKRRFRSLDLTIFRDPHDLRRRLVRRTDLEAAFGPPSPIHPPPPPSVRPTVADGDRRHRRP